MSTQVVVRLLKDGSGRVRIHYFVRDEAGPIRTPAGVIALTAMGPMSAGGTKGYIACQPKQESLDVKKDGIIYPTPHSDDVRAVTCPECQATAEYKKMADFLAELADTETKTGV